MSSSSVHVGLLPELILAASIFAWSLRFISLGHSALANGPRAESAKLKAQKSKEPQDLR